MAQFLILRPTNGCASCPQPDRRFFDESGGSADDDCRWRRQHHSHCFAARSCRRPGAGRLFDHAAQNIRVNALSPGAIETRRLVLRYGDMATARQLAAPKHLVNRLGQPEEIAQAALFLASNAASFMTGADMLVDGGYTTI
jgi:enoyl-ACP reductase-like protein